MSSSETDYNIISHSGLTLTDIVAAHEEEISALLTGGAMTIYPGSEETDNALLDYRIKVLTKADLTDALAAQMLGLQNKVAVANGADARNVIVFRTKEDIAAHYARGDISLAIFLEDGTLIGQTLLTYKAPEEDNVTPDPSVNIPGLALGWLMVDPAYRRNQLCERLIHTACLLADKADLDYVKARVRQHNERGIGKFLSEGFAAVGTGTNTRDGSKNVKLVRLLRHDLNIDHNGEEFLAPQELKDDAGWTRLSVNLEKGLVGLWCHTRNCVRMHPAIVVRT